MVTPEKNSQCRPVMGQCNSNQLLESVAGLDSLASDINLFKYRFDELTSHLNFIEKSIDGHVNLKKECSQVSHRVSKRSLNNLKYWCELSDGKQLRRCIVRLLNNLESLRVELPKAIKRAPNPGLLVLECIGGFYCQGGKAYKKDQRLWKTRMAAVLALESLLLANADKPMKVEKNVRTDAIQAAELWKKRIIADGGLDQACSYDALGLIFLTAAYGIHYKFSDDEIWVLASIAVKENHFAFRCSPSLSWRIRDILKKMTKSKLKIDALNIVKAFGMEKNFPLESILESFLKQCDEEFDKRRNKSKHDVSVQRQALENHLVVLKSALRFMEDWKFDSIKLPLYEMISKLESEDQDINEKSIVETKERRLSGKRSLKNSVQRTKHSRLSSSESSVSSLSQFQSESAIRVNKKTPIKEKGLETCASAPVDEHQATEPDSFKPHPDCSHSPEPMNTDPLPRSLVETVVLDQTGADHVHRSSSRSETGYHHTLNEVTELQNHHTSQKSNKKRKRRKSCGESNDSIQQTKNTRFSVSEVSVLPVSSKEFDKQSDFLLNDKSSVKEKGLESTSAAEHQAAEPLTLETQPDRTLPSKGSMNSGSGSKWETAVHDQMCADHFYRHNSDRVAGYRHPVEEMMTKSEIGNQDVTQESIEEKEMLGICRENNEKSLIQQTDFHRHLNSEFHPAGPLSSTKLRKRFETTRPSDEHRATVPASFEPHSHSKYSVEEPMITNSVVERVEHDQMGTDNFHRSRSDIEAGNSLGAIATCFSDIQPSAFYKAPMNGNVGLVANGDWQISGRLGEENGANDVNQSMIESFIGYPESPLGTYPTSPFDRYAFVDKVLEIEFGLSG